MSNEEREVMLKLTPESSRISVVIDKDMEDVKFIQNKEIRKDWRNLQKKAQSLFEKMKFYEKRFK